MRMGSRSEPPGLELTCLFREFWGRYLDTLADPTVSFSSAKQKFVKAVEKTRSKAEAGDRDAEQHLYEGVRDCVRILWKVVFARPAIYSSVPVSVFGVVGAGNLDDLLFAARLFCSADRWARFLMNGSELLDAATRALASVSVPESDHEKVAGLLEWWGDEICEKRWGVTNLWRSAGRTQLVTSEPGALAQAAATGNLPLIDMLLRRGVPIDGCAAARFEGGNPLRAAFVHREAAAFSRLLDAGANPRRLPSSIFAHLVQLQRSNPALNSMLDKLISAWPGLLLNDFPGSSDIEGPFSFLDVALSVGHHKLAEQALDAGAPIRYGTEKTALTVHGGKEVPFKPTLAAAMTVNNLPVLRRLISREAVLDGWREKYGETAKRCIGSALSKLIVRAYGLIPCPQSQEIISLLVDCPDPFIQSWAATGNTVLEAIFSGDGLLDAESQAIEALKRFKAAGFNVVSLKKMDFDAGVLGFNLFAIAARLNLPLIMEYAHSIGIPVDVTWPVVNSEGSFTGSALNLAIKYKQPLSIVTSLLTTYKAKAAYPELGATHQPIFELLCTADRYSDSEALPLLEALIERDPTLMDLPCYTSRDAKLRVDDEPLASCCLGNKLKCFELLLQKLPAARKRAVDGLYPHSIPARSARAQTPCTVTWSLAQVCAADRKWDFLDLLMRHTKCTMNDTPDPDVPSVAWQVQALAARRTQAPPRALVTAVNARARAELEEFRREFAQNRSASAASTASTTAAPSTASAPAVAQSNAFESNAFEDPSLTALPDKEAKRKAKKKAAKKKARAKKRAKKAANAGAGALPIAEDSSDNSSSGDDDEAFDEPDDNLVDSSNAPSVDVMFAAMGLGPGGAPKTDNGAEKK